MMRTLMKVFCVFTVLTGVLMKSEVVFEGTVGGSVEIRCPYPDDYNYFPKYLCRDPCESAHVLIKSEKTDQVISDGRYSLIDNLNGRFFTVSIRNLRLRDSGVYYCGIDKWFTDELNKVNLSVHPVNRSSHTTTNTIITTAWTTTLTSAESSPSYNLLTVRPDFTPSIIHSSSLGGIVVCLCVLSLLGFMWILVGFYRKRLNAKSRCHTTENTDSPDFKTVDYACYVCEETMVVYNLVDPPKRDSCSLICSVVNYCDPLTQEQSHSGM